MAHTHEKNAHARKGKTGVFISTAVERIGRQGVRVEMKVR